MKQLKKYIGTKEFYKTVCAVAIPIMIQNGITNFVNLLDNVMIGSVGTEPMSAVSIVNQLLFVFNLCIFGGLSGIGIFTAQFYGKQDHKNIRYSMRLMLLLSFVLFLIGISIFSMFGSQLIKLYIHEDGIVGNMESTLRYGQQYLSIIMLGLLPFCISQTYSTTLRACGETVLPMTAGITAVFVNLIGNYLLIYGHFGLPALGIVGGAIATVLSRFVEALFLIIFVAIKGSRFPYLHGLYKSLYIPLELAKQCISKSIPLLFNETLWSMGQATLLQNYSRRGLSVVAAMNISFTLQDVFNISFIAVGNAIAILLGQKLGAGKHEEAKEESGKLIFFSIMVSSFAGVILFIIAPLFPELYNTDIFIREIATKLIRVIAVCMPLYAITNASYFIIRSGGKTGITFLFDCGFSWLIMIPCAYILVNFTNLPIVPVYLCVNLLDIIKCIIGLTMVHKGIWLQDITNIKE